VPSDAGYTRRPGKAQSGAMAAIRMALLMRLPTQGREIHAKDHHD
jgi:hypothetical protein